MRWTQGALLLLVCVLMLNACGGTTAEPFTPSSPPTAASAPTSTPSPTDTPAPSATATAAPTNTPTPTRTPVPPTSTPTATPTPTDTPSPTAQPSGGALPTPSDPPLPSWNDLPVMPQAVAGDEEEGSYWYSVAATPQEIEEYYAREMQALGWEYLARGTGRGSNLMLVFTKAAYTATVAVIDQEDGTALVMLVLS